MNRVTMCKVCRSKNLEWDCRYGDGEQFCADCGRYQKHREMPPEQRVIEGNRLLAKWNKAVAGSNAVKQSKIIRVDWHAVGKDES